MTLRITVLVDNVTGGDPATLNWFFQGEYALSMLVETEDRVILFDTGLASAVVHNARLLGIDFSRIDTVVLSHGHEDHVGGLREVLRRTGPVDVVAHPSIWDVKYGKLGDVERYVGIPFRREELESLGARFLMSEDPVSIGKYALTTGEVPLITEYEQVDPACCVKVDGMLEPDPLADDLSLVVRTAEGLVVIMGCAHRGMINHLLRAREVTGEERIHAVVGGTHLSSASGQRISDTVKDLTAMAPSVIAPCHCTEFRGMSMLAHAFGDRFLEIHTSKSFEI
ncbi:MAG: MBL fold metallo-hydrolase [Desulfatiglandaceae bacterium]